MYFIRILQFVHTKQFSYESDRNEEDKPDDFVRSTFILTTYIVLSLKKGAAFYWKPQSISCKLDVRFSFSIERSAIAHIYKCLKKCLFLKEAWLTYHKLEVEWKREFYPLSRNLRTKIWRRYLGTWLQIIFCKNWGCLLASFRSLLAAASKWQWKSFLLQAMLERLSGHQTYTFPNMKMQEFS